MNIREYQPQNYQRVICCLVLAASALQFAFLTVSPCAAFAEDNASAHQEQNVYYLGNTVKTGVDTGYTGEESIKEGDPHFGWDLGKFSVSGFTAINRSETPVFLKNAGDQVSLDYILEQDIDNLNGNERMRIAEDKNGFDQEFGISKTNLGRGALIVRHTNYQNSSTKPQLYIDYLPSITKSATTNVGLYDEGDYEIALDYEIESPGFPDLPFVHTYNSYRNHFKFKVRNSNAMAFLFDLATGSELYNGSVTQSGFRIDLAESHYLDVNVKRELLNETGDGLAEDTRYNRSASSGDEFTEEGIYTITVKNSTTDDQTEKKLYVGNDMILKAVVANSMDVKAVRQSINEGASVAADGSLINPADAVEGSHGSSTRIDPTIPIVLIVFVAGLAIMFLFANRKAPKSSTATGTNAQAKQGHLPNPSADDKKKSGGDNHEAR